MRRIAVIAAFLAAAMVGASAQVITPAARGRAADLVSQMTLEEKIDFISGDTDGFSIRAIPRLGIPRILMADGPQGVRNRTKSTYYPCGVAAAASWNRDAAFMMGRGIGRDARARGVGIMLGPGVNIYRSALCGRNFEYFGEDPYLASETALQYILGMQEMGVIATIKHFALNNEEFDRHSLTVVADERTMHEIYFETFRKAVQQGKVGAVMTSYNMINGQHAPESPWLIRETLRKQWGFQGIVMSDWTSTYSTLGCLQAGLDLEMPHPRVYLQDAIKGLLENGIIDESILDEKVQHILQTLIAFDLLDKPATDTSIPEDSEESRAACREIAVEAPVLLKNNGVLPLKGGKKNTIVLTGPMADRIPKGGGSGNVIPIEGRTVTMAEAFASLDPKKFKVEYLADDAGAFDTPQNLEAMKKASAVIVAVGFDSKLEGEGHDRTFELPEGQDDLIEKALECNSNVVVVVVSGGEVGMERWLNKAAAVLMSWYDGQEIGTAVASLLTGKVAPSGKLPFTIWGSAAKNPSSAYYHPTMTATKSEWNAQRHTERLSRYKYTEYGDGVFVGYRGAEHFGVKPLYPFGYGISYTTFNYSGLEVVPAGDGFDVTFTVSNAGKVDAKEVAEVYVSPVDPKILRPVRELKQYAKVSVPKGGSASVTVHLDLRSFAYYSVADKDWRVDAGNYRIEIGKSSEDIVLSTEVSL